MNSTEQYSKEIERFFVDYKSYLNIQANKGLYDTHKYAEFFFKQLLNIIFDWDIQHTEEKYSINTSGIDLFSSKGDGYSIQVTAQRSSYDKKIKKTISDYEENWKNKYKKLKILFIQENVNELSVKYNSDDGNIEIISFKEINKEINKFGVHKKKKILDFLKREVGKEIGASNNYYGFKHFEEAMKGNIKSFTSNNLFFQNGFLYYTKEDVDLIDKCVNIISNKKGKIYIDGPPCSGKTTLLFKLVNALEKKLIRCFYIDVEKWENEFLNELSLYENLDVLLIIDNSQINNYEIAKSIYNQCENTKCLFISRENSNKEDLSSLINFNFDLTYSLSKNTELNQKIKGIIDNRVKYLKDSKPKNNWDIGNYETIYENCQRNLLQISIILTYWEYEFFNDKLDDISLIKCYQEFYKSHINNQMDERITFKYSNIYQYNCPFKLVNTFSSEIKKNIEQGIFIRTKNADLYYKFPHTEYAKLLVKSISYENNVTTEYEVNEINNYLINDKPNNIHLLINGLILEEKYTHIDYIFTNNECSDIVFKHYVNRKNEIFDLKTLVFGLYKIKNKLNSESAKSFLTKLLSLFETFNIKTFEKNGEDIINKVKDFTNYYEIDISKYKIKSEKSSKYYSKTFFELSELVSKNIQNNSIINDVANSHSFSDWKRKFINHNDSFSKKVEGLTSLKKSPITRQLAYDLYFLIDVETIFNELKDAPIDIIGKTLNNLSIFASLDGSKRTKNLFKLFKENGSFENQIKYGLSKFSIGLSHLNKVDSDFVQTLYPSDNQIEELFNSASANDFAQRIPLFINCFPNRKTFFLSILRKALNNHSFYSQKNNNLQGYIALIRVIKKQKYPFKKYELENLVDKALHNISHKNSLIELSDAIDILKKYIPNNIQAKLITAERISSELDRKKITIKELEQILITKLNLELSIEIYSKIKTSSLIKGCLSNNVSFEQFTKVLMQLSNREFDLNKNKNISKKLINELFNNHKVNVIKKAKSSNIYDLIAGYCRLHKIDNYVTEKYLLHLIIENSKINHKEVTLSNSMQGIRKLKTLSNKTANYNEIAKDYIINSKKSLLENAELIDIGKISDGLKEISIEFKDISTALFKELFNTIKRKSIIEKTRQDYYSRIIPQFEASISKHFDLLEELR